MTFAEKVFWQYVRRRQFARRKFRRQQIIDGFIVDFYCPRLKTVIEIDGGIHQEQKEYDRARDLILRRRGLRVLLFTNEEVITDIKAVLEKVLRFNPSRLRHPPQNDQTGQSNSNG